MGLQKKLKEAEQTMTNIKRTGVDRHRAKKIKKYLPLYCLMAFPLLHIFVLKIIPLFGVLISFERYRPTKGIFGSQWVGLDNFRSFFNSHYFELIFSNTLILSVLGLIISFPLSIIFALMLNEVRHQRFKKAVQMITYAPHFISVVVLVGVMQQIFDPTIGILQFFVGKEAASQILLMADPKYFRLLHIGSGVWQSIGWSSILHTASLSNVSVELYDAARVDGATLMQKIRNIDFPCLVPTISITLIMAIGGIMNTGFDKIYLMQNGTNINVSEVISTFVYKKGLLQADFGYSTAVGLFNSIINCIMIVGANFTVKKITGESMY